MKSNKILALILSVAMLFTMSITAFADEGVTVTKMTMQEFSDAINNGDVTLNNDTEIEGQIGQQNNVIFNKDCVLDLNGKTLEKGTINFLCVSSGATVTVKNGTIAFSKAPDSIFRPEAGSTLNLENVTFSQDKSNYQEGNVGTIINAQGACTINVTNCTMTNLKAETAVICTNAGNGSSVNITKTNISSENSDGDGVALFGGVMVVTDCEIEAVRPIRVINDKQTVILTGNTTVKGDILANSYTDSSTGETTYGKIIKAGSDVTFDGITNTSAVKNATCIVTGANGDITCFEDVSEAMKPDNANGKTVTLLADVPADKPLKGNNWCYTDATTIELNGHILTLEQSNTGAGFAFGKNVTINGDSARKSTIQFNMSGTSCLALFNAGTNAMANSYLKLSGLTIQAPKQYTSGCGLLGAITGSTLELENVTINAEEGVGVTDTCCKTIFYGDGFSANGTLKIKDVDVTNVSNEELIYGFTNMDIDDLQFTGSIAKYLISCANGTVKNSSFTYTNGSTGAVVRDYNGTYQVALNFENTKINDIPTCEEGVFNLGAKSVIKADANTEIDTEEKAFEAKIGDTYYSSFAKALAEAKDNDTVTLLADAAMATGFKNSDKSIIIDLNQKTLTVDGTIDNLCENVTFKNGNITVIGDGTGKTAAFYIFDKDKYLVFDNVKIDANAFTGTYLIADDWCNTNGRIEIINGTEIYYNSDTEKKLSTVIHLNDATATLKIDNSKINVANTSGHIINNNGGDVVISGNSEITGTNVGTSGIFNMKGKSLTIKDNAVVTITGVKGSEEWNPEKAGIVLGADTPYKKADEAKVNATIYRTPGINNLAEEIAVTFTDVTENEGEKVYDIYAETATDKTINGLTALQLALKLDTTNDFAMTVTGPDGMPITAVDGLYLFNYDGTTKASATGEKIKIGQVKLVGNGTFTLSIDDTKENFANTTSFDGENTDVKYVANATDKKLDISNKLENITIKAPTKDLAINIDFKHTVYSQVADYQNMTVTVTGPNNYEKVIKLGSDETKIVDNKAEIEIKDELAYRARYNVEVKGAGYRTVNYQVIMDDNKTLSFWNNYKDKAVNVEENDGMPVNTTFLAGDILPDGRINIYDLSAVVSYFGMKDLEEDPEAYAKYAQFDLNRDGKINSEDVAYVLLSWGR